MTYNFFNRNTFPVSTSLITVNNNGFIPFDQITNTAYNLNNDGLSNNIQGLEVTVTQNSLNNLYINGLWSSSSPTTLQANKCIQFNKTTSYNPWVAYAPQNPLNNDVFGINKTSTRALVVYKDSTQSTTVLPSNTTTGNFFWKWNNFTNSWQEITLLEFNTLKYQNIVERPDILLPQGDYFIKTIISSNVTIAINNDVNNILNINTLGVNFKSQQDPLNPLYNNYISLYSFTSNNYLLIWKV